jgi:hypothetical protein
MDFKKKKKIGELSSQLSLCDQLRKVSKPDLTVANIKHGVHILQENVTHDPEFCNCEMILVSTYEGFALANSLPPRESSDAAPARQSVELES